MREVRIITVESESQGAKIWPNGPEMSQSKSWAFKFNYYIELSKYDWYIFSTILGLKY